MEKLCEMLIGEPRALGALNTVEVSWEASKGSRDLGCICAGQGGIAQQSQFSCFLISEYSILILFL